MNIPLTKITQEIVQKAINKESLTHSPKSVRNMHGVCCYAHLSPRFCIKYTLPNIQGNLVHIKSAMVPDENNKWVVKAPKSFAGDRIISFPDFVAEKFKGINGRIVKINPSQITDRFADVLKKNKLEHFRFHDLRHYSASIQHALGIPDVYIIQRGGWGSDGVLRSVCRHAMDDKLKEMNEATNRHFEEVCNIKKAL